MQAVKLCSSKILQLLIGMLANAGGGGGGRGGSFNCKIDSTFLLI